jgi:hypothetical protein
MFEKISQHQPPLFIEDVYDALRSAVQVLGGPKVVSVKLWPTKPPEQARTSLLDCLNRDNDRKFDLEEVLAIMKMAAEVGFHDSKHWIDRAIGYQPTPPLDPVLERDRLAVEFANLADAVKNATRAMERLTVEPNVRAVK